MSKRITKKTLIYVAVLYGVVVSLINFFGFTIVSTQQMPMKENDALLYWIDYINKHNFFINTISVSSFLIPIICLICYVTICAEDKIESRIINMPLVYSLIGSLGWFISLLLECIMLFFIHSATGINMHSVAMSSFLNIVQCCIFICTLAFMCLYTIHRMYVLPKYFPEGKLSDYKGSKKVSTAAIITIFYCSVSVFPVFYLISMLRNYSLNVGFEIDYSVYYMSAGVMALGVVLLITVTGCFSSPLRKLKTATESIKMGHYDKKIDVVSNDDYGELADNFNSMSEALLDKSQKIVSIQNSIIRGMAMMVESRDNSTGGHINRTSECVRVFIGKMKESGKFSITDEYAEALIKAAPMHDLGKIAVDDAILRKPGRFEPEEFEKMKKHAEEGARIVSAVLKDSDDEEFKEIATNVAHFHHEKWDGSGYPTHISGEDIPYEARIMALADVFDALVSKRCYKESMSFDKAFSIIEESLDQHFDPVLGKFFISCRKELEELYMNLPE